MASDPRMNEAAMDAAALYREEIYTDRKIGTLRVLSPVKTDGTPDPLRRTVFQGEAQLMTNMGPLPITFDIEANTLQEAIDKFPEGVKVALEQAIEEAREMRRESASRIVVPDVGGGNIGPGPGGGGGKIKF